MKIRYFIILLFITNIITQNPEKCNNNICEELLKITNEERRKNGNLPSLKLQNQLSLAAEKHTIDMIKNNFFDHRGSSGSSPFDRMRAEGYRFSAAAENIAAGQRYTFINNI
jgi:uncharacterized protein YkwD